MRISELAARTGLSIDTIRFYEKMGLLDNAHGTRQPNGYRDYFETAVERLELIKNGRMAGFTLSIKRASSSGNVNCPQKTS